MRGISLSTSCTISNNYKKSSSSMEEMNNLDYKFPDHIVMDNNSQENEGNNNQSDFQDFDMKQVKICQQISTQTQPETQNDSVLKDFPKLNQSYSVHEQHNWLLDQQQQFINQQNESRIYSCMNIEKQDDNNNIQNKQNQNMNESYERFDNIKKWLDQQEIQMVEPNPAENYFENKRSMIFEQLKISKTTKQILKQKNSNNQSQSLHESPKRGNQIFKCSANKLFQGRKKRLQSLNQLSKDLNGNNSSSEKNSNSKI